MRVGIFLVAAAFLLSSCSEKSKVVDPSTLPQGSLTKVFGDTSYIQMQPVWGGFYGPKDIKIGYDYILYVTEPDSNRIVMVDLAGNRLGYSQYVKHPVAIAEDRKFNLVITCEFDTTVGAQTITVAAIAKIRLFDYQHKIADAPVEMVHHESLQKQIVRDAAGNLISGRAYTGVAPLPDNSYYVTRTGSDNASPVDPDNMILHFSKSDKQYSSDFIDLVPNPMNLTPTGTGLVAINQLSNITTFNSRQYGTDFIVTQIDPENSYKVKWFTFNAGSEFQAPSWVSKFSLDPSKYSPPGLPAILSNIFIMPQAVTIDDRGNIYVVDSWLDSLMKFDMKGSLLHESFGNFKASGSLLRPSGVAFFNKTLYVCDSGHDRILRYRLSTDFR
ncbi:MAG: hypothetical protein M1470_12640 [Bacteroidetes bacterium]|nr:hypothetical protein [Bacteroidota bacterium]MCL5738012.1 hypothetical protein [Bacteroidota bacterium]